MKASLNARKQSHDVRTRNNFGATTMSNNGGGYKDALLSPRNVVDGARNDLRLNNTVTEGMSVNGARKQGWDNPDSTARNGLGQRNSHNLTIQDIVDNVLKKPVFGFDGYNPKATVKDLLPVNTHVRAKAKRRMFCEEASKIADKVPAADKYQSSIDWHKDPVSRNIKFYSNKRNMIADDIIHKSKNPAKTSPGPTGYNHYDGWKATLKKTPGNYKKKEDRITFVQEVTWHAHQTPGMKWQYVNLVSASNRLTKRQLNLDQPYPLFPIY